jgi:hypothetical protein
VILCDTTSGIYTNIHESATLDVGFDNQTPTSYPNVEFTNLISSGDPEIWRVGLPVESSVDESGYSVVNKGVVVSATNLSGAFTGGHADNTFTISITYLILDTATGLYV